MAGAPDRDLEKVRALVREAFLDTSAARVRDPEIYEDHPDELLVASYIDRLLPETEEARFERHVAVCARCAEELVLSSRGAAVQERSAGMSYWKIAASFALVLGGLLAAVLAGRTTGDRIGSGLLAGLESGLEGRATARSASLSVFGGPAIEFEDLSIDDPTQEEPFVVARSARFSVDVSALTGGGVEGELELDHAVFNVVRSPSGVVNIDSMLPSPERLDSLFAAAARRAIRAIRITDGTIRMVDQSASVPLEVRMAAVDASLTGLGQAGPASVSARAGLESATQNVAFKGTAGPWGEGALPRYRFAEVGFDAVPLRAFTGVRDAVRGGLSFDGRLQSAGSAWAQVSANVSGRGDMQIVSGALIGNNLVAESVGPWIGAAEAPGRLGALLASADTPFDEIHAEVRIRHSTLQAEKLRAIAPGFEVAGRGSLGGSGDVDFAGTLLVASDVSADLVSVAPFAGKLMDDKGRLSIPFAVAGVWPEIKPRVDLELIAERAFPLPRLADLFWSPRAG